jgi:hypothetical protein
MQPFWVSAACFAIISSTVRALWVSYPGITIRQQPKVRCFIVSSSKHNEEDKDTDQHTKSPPPPSPPRQGYKFGDLTRRLIGDRVNKITGKDEPYEFGDLSRWVDGRIKERIGTLTDKEEYEFGDLTKWAWNQVGNVTQNYTGKETYEVGDLSKAVIRRVRSGEYALNDVSLACRILLSAGMGFLMPVASILPLRTLLDLVNIGLAQEVSGRLLEELAGFLDRRFKEALTGNQNYQLGDLTKDKLKSAITNWTGKDSYEFGDITRHIQKLATQSTSTSGSNKTPPQIHIEENSMRDLDEWDAKFLNQHS